MVKKKVLERELLAAGFHRKKGANHDQYENADGIKISLPRHIEVNEYTAKAIRRAAGLIGKDGKK